ncbi:Hypothetical predicted protein [Octopus vulgaris]|uniref:Uncharacterized protein n=1 Tax=Octopus vulgaris TaxID=6645 RepID=A0AA36F577_OCTVU|nr:Hypothetical predicted protein [Octopus vulgaris]
MVSFTEPSPWRNETENVVRQGKRGVFKSIAWSAYCTAAYEYFTPGNNEDKEYAAPDLIIRYRIRPYYPLKSVDPEWFPKSISSITGRNIKILD